MLKTKLKFTFFFLESLERFQFHSVQQTWNVETSGQNLYTIAAIENSTSKKEYKKACCLGRHFTVCGVGIEVSVTFPMSWANEYLHLGLQWILLSDQYIYAIRSLWLCMGEWVIFNHCLKLLTLTYFTTVESNEFWKFRTAITAYSLYSIVTIWYSL